MCVLCCAQVQDVSSRTVLLSLLGPESDVVLRELGGVGGLGLVGWGETGGVGGGLGRWEVGAVCTPSRVQYIGHI